MSHNSFVMELSDAIQLIQTDRLILPVPSTWADLGCGSGRFTFALAHLLSRQSTIYAVDKSPVRLDPPSTIPPVEIKTLQLDFVAKDLPWKGLNGILMANSLHYVRDKNVLIDRLSKTLQPDGQFLIVEYDTDTPVPQWVPYPVGFSKLQQIFAEAGYPVVKHLGEHPSAFGRSNLYAALISR